MFTGVDKLVTQTPITMSSRQTVASLPQASNVSADLATTDFAVFTGVKASPLQTSGWSSSKYELVTKSPDDRGLPNAFNFDPAIPFHPIDPPSSDLDTLFSASTYLKVKNYSPDFHTQSAAASYIAGQMNGTFHYPALDQKMRDAVEEACNAWKPGMDLAKMVYDKVRAALTGVLPESPTGSGTSPRFDYPQTPDAVARQAAAQIRANGNTVAGVAEHMLWTPIQTP